MDVGLYGVSMMVEAYAPEDVHSMRISLLIDDVEVVDKVKKSLLNKFLCAYKSESEPRESFESMARFDYVFVRVPGMSDEEAIVRLALLPLRLNVDQDTLDFLITFFACMTAYEEMMSTSYPAPDATAPLPYFKICHITPIVAVIDYDPKHLALSSLLRGNLRELSGLLSLRSAVLRLPAVIVKGTVGLPATATAVAEQWLASYSDKLPGLLFGVPLVRPVSNVVAAGARLVHQPFAAYPRVWQGLRQGIFGGVTTTTVEFCNVSVALLFATQSALSTAQTVLSGQTQPRTRTSAQPSSVTDGFAAAASAFRSGFTGLWSRLRPSQRSSVFHSVSQLPAATLQPLIAICESTSLVLQGFRNSLHPDTRRDLDAKYRHE